MNASSQAIIVIVVFCAGKLVGVAESKRGGSWGVEKSKRRGFREGGRLEGGLK